MSAFLHRAGHSAQGAPASTSQSMRETGRADHANCACASVWQRDRAVRQAPLSLHSDFHPLLPSVTSARPSSSPLPGEEAMLWVSRRQRKILRRSRDNYTHKAAVTLHRYTDPSVPTAGRCPPPCLPNSSPGPEPAPRRLSRTWSKRGIRLISLEKLGIDPVTLAFSAWHTPNPGYSQGEQTMCEKAVPPVTSPGTWEVLAAGPRAVNHIRKERTWRRNECSTRVTKAGVPMKWRLV